MIAINNSHEISLFNKICPETLQNLPKLEEDTVGQDCNQTWVNERKKTTKVLLVTAIKYIFVINSLKH